jgi:hypothetical protein
MKAKITLKHKDSEDGEILVMYNEVFNKSNGVAFFEIEKDKWDLIDYKPFVFSAKGVDYYEGDRVIVKGRKRIGEYETEIVKDSQGWTLKENNTYLNDDACFIAIKEKL